MELYFFVLFAAKSHFFVTMHFEKGIHFVSDPPNGAHQRQIRSEDNCEEIGAEERRYCIKDIIASHIVRGNVFYLFLFMLLKDCLPF